MAEYLVTGGAGFIGSHLVERLLSKNKTVAVLDNLATGKLENIAPFRDRISFYQGSVCDDDMVKKAMAGARIVFHQAALASVPRSIKNPWDCHQANVEGTLKILLHARDLGVKRVMFAGSSSVYGNTEVLPKVETMKPGPLSPYAAAKLAGESYCQVFREVYGLETVILRYFNVFGPRQDPASEYAAVIPKFIQALRNNQPVNIFGDGEQTRDFNYIENVVSANMLAAEAPSTVAGKVFNVAGGSRISLNQLLNYLQQILKTNISPIYAPPRAGDVRHSLADISQAQQYLNYKPLVDVKTGLEKTVEWFLSKK